MSTIDFKKIKPEILKKEDDFTKFTCGKQPIDDFIHNEALDFQNERLGASYVFRHNGEIIGFVTLSMADLKKEKLKGNDRLQIGKENYPALQISQLAVCKNHENNKIGTFLCDFSLAIAYQLSEKVGCRFLVLNAKKDVIGFYEKYGFKLLPNQEKRQEPIMFLNIFSKKQATIV
jgi:predicted N-acetyltransferase YhbS